MDKRCAACVIQGGSEPPCLPPHYLVIEEEKGYPCPRREARNPEDWLTMQLAGLAAREWSAPIFREMVGAYEFTPAERRVVLRRILRAYGDETIRAVFWPTAG